MGKSCYTFAVRIGGTLNQYRKFLPILAVLTTDLRVEAPLSGQHFDSQFPPAVDWACSHNDTLANRFVHEVIATEAA